MRSGTYTGRWIICCSNSLPLSLLKAEPDCVMVPGVTKAHRPVEGMKSYSRFFTCTLWNTQTESHRRFLHKECAAALLDLAIELTDPPVDRQTLPPSSNSLVLGLFLCRCVMWSHSWFISSPSRMKTSAIWSRGERSNLRLVMRMASLGGCRRGVRVCVCVWERVLLSVSASWVSIKH